MKDLSLAPRYRQLRDELTAGPRTWLVTGAAGFIGSNLVEELLGLGQRVVGLDNLSTGFEANLADATGMERGEDRFRFIEGDIRDLARCRDACAGVDYVLHEAALASVPESIADPIESAQVNVDGTINMLVAARDAGVRRFVYASSSAVYGDTTAVPAREGVTGQLLSPYAATKATNEMYAALFQRTYGLQTVGLRYFNVFGRRQDPNGAYAAVIPRWVDKLLSDEPCEIYGDGETTRDFCYVSDVVQANLLAATVDDPGATGQVYNVACGEETSLNELFHMIRLGLRRYHPAVVDARPRYEDARQGDIRRSVAEIAKAREGLGYMPAFRVATGLAQALHWYASRAQRSGPEAASA
jgi:UDP-N-acetylglucosamine 4-epimerase